MTVHMILSYPLPAEAPQAYIRGGLTGSKGYKLKDQRTR